MRATSQALVVVGAGALTLAATTAPALAFIPSDPGAPATATVAAARTPAAPSASTRTRISAPAAWWSARTQSAFTFPGS